MANADREIAVTILGASHRNAAEFGLRFDRVVVRVLEELRTFAEETTPSDMTLVVTVSAPIRSPAKTLTILKEDIARVVAGAVDQVYCNIQGNAVRVCAVRQALDPAPRLIGFVHTSRSSSALLVELAQHWLPTHA